MRSTLLALKHEEIGPQTVQQESPFSISFKEMNTNELNAQSSRKSWELSETEQKSLVQKTQHKSKFSIDGLNVVLNAELGPLQLCDIECNDLKRTVARIKDYSKGILNGEYESDPAFQLANRMNQAALGPAGKEALSIMQQFQDNPVSFKSVAKLSQFLWRLDEIVKTMKNRRNTRALEVDDLMSILLYESKTCELNKWNNRCSVLNDEIHSWVEGGALH